MMTFLLLSFTLAGMLLVWFNTNAVTEYLELFKLDGLLRSRKYKQERQSFYDRRMEVRRKRAEEANKPCGSGVPCEEKKLAQKPPVKEPEFLGWWQWVAMHGGFIGRLLACPFCLGAWLSLAICSIAKCAHWAVAVYFVGLFFYKGFIHALRVR